MTLTVVDIANAEGADDERFRRGLDQIRGVCQRVGRILTGDDRLRVETYTGNAPFAAWIKGNVITLAQEKITEMVAGDMSDRMKVSVCLLFHEMGHFMFDPKFNDPAWKIRKTKLRQGDAAKYATHMMMLNVLNDQRHEIMTAGIYPVARDYFREATLRLMQTVINEMGGLPTENYLLYYGRRHILPAPILTRLRAAMVQQYGEPKTVKAEALINEYIALTLSAADIERMWDIAAEMAAMFPPPKTDDCLGQGETGAGSDAKTTDRASKAARKQMEQADKGKGQPQPSFGGDEDEDEAGEGDGEDEGDAASGKAKPGKPGEGDEAGASGTGKDKGEQGKGQDRGGQSAGLGTPHKVDQTVHTTPPPDENKSIADMVEDAHDEASDVLGKDLEPYMLALREALEDASIHDDDVSEHVKKASDRLADMFEKVNVDLELHELRGLRSGRLDVRRAVHAVTDGSNRIFRKRQEDISDDARMGVYIAVDASGSMQGQFARAIDSGLAIGRGAEKAGHMVKVCAFDDSYEVVKGWFSKSYHKADWSQHGGGTPFVPMLSKLDAEFDALFKAESIRHSVVFIITDGMHGESEQAVRKIMAATKRKHATHIYWIGISAAPRGYKEVERVVKVDSVADLEHAMRGVMHDLAIQFREDAKEGR